MNKEKVAVYIDGSNFYNYLKDKKIKFPKGVKFDFKKFVDLSRLLLLEDIERFKEKRLI